MDTEKAYTFPVHIFHISWLTRVLQTNESKSLYTFLLACFYLSLEAMHDRSNILATKKSKIGLIEKIKSEKLKREGPMGND